MYGSGRVLCYNISEQLTSKSSLSSPVKMVTSRDHTLCVPDMMYTHFLVFKFPLQRQNWRYSAYPKHNLVGQRCLAGAAPHRSPTRYFQNSRQSHYLGLVGLGRSKYGEMVRRRPRQGQLVGGLCCSNVSFLDILYFHGARAQDRPR